MSRSLPPKVDLPPANYLPRVSISRQKSDFFLPISPDFFLPPKVKSETANTISPAKSHTSHLRPPSLRCTLPPPPTVLHRRIKPINPTEEVLMADHSEDIHQPRLATCSVESLLSVPLRFIFRETRTGDRGANNHPSFLFSKSEVSTLLRVSMVSGLQHEKVF